MPPKSNGPPSSPPHLHHPRPTTSSSFSSLIAFTPVRSTSIYRLHDFSSTPPSAPPLPTIPSQALLEFSADVEAEGQRMPGLARTVTTSRFRPRPFEDGEEGRARSSPGPEARGLEVYRTGTVGCGDDVVDGIFSEGDQGSQGLGTEVAIDDCNQETVRSLWQPSLARAMLEDEERASCGQRSAEHEELGWELLDWEGNTSDDEMADNVSHVPPTPTPRPTTTGYHKAPRPTRRSSTSRPSGHDNAEARATIGRAQNRTPSDARTASALHSNAISMHTAQETEATLRAVPKPALTAASITMAASATTAPATADTATSPAETHANPPAQHKAQHQQPLPLPQTEAQEKQQHDHLTALPTIFMTEVYRPKPHPQPQRLHHPFPPAPTAKPPPCPTSSPSRVAAAAASPSHAATTPRESPTDEKTQASSPNTGPDTHPTPRPTRRWRRLLLSLRCLTCLPCSTRLRRPWRVKQRMSGKGGDKEEGRDQAVGRDRKGAEVKKGEEEEEEEEKKKKKKKKAPHAGRGGDQGSGDGENSGVLSGDIERGRTRRRSRWR